MRRGRGGAAGAGRARPPEAPRRGSRTTNSLPAPLPPLRRLDAAAVQLDEPLHEREAEPEAPQPPLERGVGLAERLEEAGQHGRLDAGAGVPDAQLRDVVDRAEGEPRPSPRSA